MKICDDGHLPICYEEDDNAYDEIDCPLCRCIKLTGKEKEEIKYRCSFCGKKSDDVFYLIAGFGEKVFICDECTQLCSEIITEEREKDNESKS
jgi:hypothetical protein